MRLSTHAILRIINNLLHNSVISTVCVCSTVVTQWTKHERHASSDTICYLNMHQRIFDKLVCVCVCVCVHLQWSWGGDVLQCAEEAAWCRRSKCNTQQLSLWPACRTWLTVRNCSASLPCAGCLLIHEFCTTYTFLKCRPVECRFRVS